MQQPSRDEFLYSPSAKLPASVLARLFDHALWQPVLKNYTDAVHLSVALIDWEGNCGAIVNPRPTWTLLRDKVAPTARHCPFSLLSVEPCTCVEHAWKTGGIVTARDRATLVHFAVPLLLGEHRVGALVGGQVFDQYPDQLVLEHLAQQVELSFFKLWQMARLEHPVKKRTLQVYANLLWMLGDIFLQTHYQKLVEGRLRDTLQDRVTELEQFEASVVGRELRMIELEQEMETLKRQAARGLS